MSGTSDKAEGTMDRTKGKVKEAVGDLADDKHLEREGKKDQAEAAAEKVKGHLKDATDAVKQGLEDLGN